MSSLTRSFSVNAPPLFLSSILPWIVDYWVNWLDMAELSTTTLNIDITTKENLKNLHLRSLCLIPLSNNNSSSTWKLLMHLLRTSVNGKRWLRQRSSPLHFVIAPLNGFVILNATIAYCRGILLDCSINTATFNVIAGVLCSFPFLISSVET
jgi:hypothetical protein